MGVIGWSPQRRDFCLHGTFANSYCKPRGSQKSEAKKPPLLSDCTPALPSQNGRTLVDKGTRYFGTTWGIVSRQFWEYLWSQRKLTRQRQHTDHKHLLQLLWLTGILPCSQRHLWKKREVSEFTDRRHIPTMKEELQIDTGFDQLQLNSSERDQHKPQLAEIALFSKVIFSFHDCGQGPIIDQYNTISFL